jgi:ferrous-iron efflux pump FieF
MVTSSEARRFRSPSAEAGRVTSSAVARLGNRRTRAGAVSLAVATALLALKLGAGLLTGSLSLLASAVDSLTDILASAVNFFAMRAASRPADDDHEYGHEKAESLAGLFQGVVIAGSGVFLGYESVRRLLEPRPLEFAAVGLAVMATSTAASYLLVRYLRRVALETGSVALTADSLHYATDVLANLGVFATLLVVRFTGWHRADALVSLAISAYIVYAATGVLRDAVDGLMDRALPEEVHERVREIVAGHSAIRGMHDLKTRSSGARRFIELHLEIDGAMSLRDAHDAAVQVLREVEAEIPNSKVFVHTDPV